MFNRFCVGALLLVGLAVSLTSCTSSPSLTAITVSPTTMNFGGEGLTTQLTATGYYTHPGHPALTKNITDQVSWASSTPQCVTVSNTGLITSGYNVCTNILVTASAPGFNGLISGSMTVNVTQPNAGAGDVVSIAVIPTAQTVATLKVPIQYVAVGTTHGGATVALGANTGTVWASSSTAVATINPSTGLATSVGSGATTITATFTNQDGSSAVGNATLTVSPSGSPEPLTALTVAPNAQTALSIGQTAQFLAIATTGSGTSVNLTNQSATVDNQTIKAAVWTSSNPSVATIDAATGIATAKGAGASVITAIGTNPDGSVVTGAATYTVTVSTTASEPLTALAIVPATQTSLATGTGANVQFFAIGTTASGATVNLTSVAYPIPGTSQKIQPAAWASSNPVVASFASPTGGIATPNSGGATAITAIATNPDGTVVTAVAVYTVTVPTVTEPYVSLAIVPASQTVTAAGQVASFIAIGTTGSGATVDLTNASGVKWTSSSLAVAKPYIPTGQTAPTPGQFAAVANGAAVITAEVPNLNSKGQPDGTVVTASAALTVAIAATPEPLLSLAVLPNAQSVAGAPETAQFLAIGDFSTSYQFPGTQNMANVTTYTVNWYSSNPAVATVCAPPAPCSTTQGSSVTGTPVFVTAVGPGTTAITAIATNIKDGSAATATATFTVTGLPASEITALSIIPSSQTVTLPLATGTPPVPTTDFIAIGTNGSTGLQQKVAVNWTSSNTAVATISNTGNTSGWATAVGQGTTTITAQYTNQAVGSTQANVVTATATLTVNGVAAEPLLSLALLPSGQSIAYPGQSSQLIAIGTFSAAPVTQNLTDSAAYPIKWSSSNTAVATVSTAANPTCTLNNATPPVCVNDPDGLVKAVGQGTAVITAIAPANDPSDNSVVTGVATITVTNGVAEQVTALTVIPGSLTLSATGQPGQFVALGTSGTTGLQEDVTDSPQLAWTSSIPSYATVCTKAVGSTPPYCPTTPGQAQGVSTGTTNITAEWTNPATSTTPSSVVTAQASVTVTTTPAAEPLLSISVLPTSTTDLDLEGNAQFLAYGTFSTAPTVLDITNGFFHAGFNSASCTAADAAQNAQVLAADSAANLPVNNLPYSQCPFIPTTWISTAPYIFPINSAGTAGATGGLSVADGSGNTDIYAVASNPDSTLVYSPMATFACPYAAPTYGTISVTDPKTDITTTETDYNDLLNPGTCNTLTIADSLLTTLNVFNAGVNTSGWLITANSATGTVDVIHCGGSVEQATQEGSVCEATYPNGTPVILTATSIPAVNPVPAVNFGGWSSSCVPCTLVGNTCTPIAAPPYYSETGPNWCTVQAGGGCTLNQNTGAYTCSDQSNVSVGAIFN